MLEVPPTSHVFFCKTDLYATWEVSFFNKSQEKQFASEFLACLHNCTMTYQERNTARSTLPAAHNPQHTTWCTETLQFDHHGFVDLKLLVLQGLIIMLKQLKRIQDAQTPGPGEGHGLHMVQFVCCSSCPSAYTRKSTHARVRAYTCTHPHTHPPQLTSTKDFQTPSCT